MATTEALQIYGQQLLFRDVTDFGPTPANNLSIGSPTGVQFNVEGLANAAAQESDKTLTLARTGTAWAGDWVLGACMETVSNSTVGASFDFYWNASPSATAPTANSGGCVGSDGLYTDAKESQLIFIGSLPCAVDVIHIKTAIGTLWMPHLYGSLVMYNNSGVAVAATPADECHVTLTPVIPDIQASA